MLSGNSSRKYDLPVYCFGHFKDPISMEIQNLIELGPVPFFHHKTLLGALPPLIGVAPLETKADQSDLDFINSKSDLKMVEFGGFGHPSVYSNAEPYFDTDLQCGVITPNDESSWFDAMEFIYREKWKDLDKEQAGVVEARNMDRIASKCWYEAIKKVQMDRPLKGSDVMNNVNRRKRSRPKVRAITWKEYDDAYYAWKDYKKNRIRRDQALMIIDNRCGLGLFFLFYPLYKLLKPFKKVKRFFKK